jgi:fibronectin type III domain
MNGNITGYTIKYQALGSYQEYTRSVGADQSLNYLKEYTYSLTGLKKLTTYKLSIAANNLAGQGSYSQEVLVKTLAFNVPNAPKITSHSILSKSSVLINWQSSNDSIVLYTLYVKRKESLLYENIIAIDKKINSNTITGLTNNQDYLIFVSATNEFGESDLSQPLLINIQSSPLSN